MKHHIVLKIGHDGYEPESATDHVVCPFSLKGGEGLPHTRTSADRELMAAGLKLTYTAEDVLALALAAYSADLFVRRDTGFDTWTRDFRLHLPVYDIERWRQCEDIIVEMLSFLSGDHWELSLRQRTDPEQTQQWVPNPSVDDRFEASAVSLFSGGLDSFIGTMEQLKEGERLLLVGHHGAGSTNKAQENVFALIKKHYKEQARLHPIYVQPPMPEWDPEKTTRARSILFLGLGHAVAAGGENPLPLHVPENGLISLNYPLTSSRLGTPSTRTTHPHFLDLFRRFLKAIGSEVTVVTPYRFQTKGEMALQVKDDPAFQEAMHQTISCSHPDVGRYRGESPGQHCGYCVPCIIRRAAMDAAGFDEPSRYLDDVLSKRPPLGSDTSRDLRAFEMAIRRFDPNDVVSHCFDVLSTGPLLPSDVQDFASVYRRGMIEVKKFINRIQ